MSEIHKIGDVSRLTGLSIDAIRFYEKQGLLPSPVRSEGGFRLFQQKDIENLRLVRIGQSLGFSLEEIRDLVCVRNGIPTPCAEVKRLLEQKLGSVRKKIAELNSLEGELASALQECKQALRKTNPAKQTSRPVMDVKRTQVAEKK